jgi:acetyltransferase-like isoleucine patch superfamily enzyme/dTDP-4-dehydrorhamnose 3,5-epimerase-like enzyme
MSFFQHPQALVESKAIGDRTRVWAFAHVLPGAVIGKECNICDHVFIENDVYVGDRVTIKCGVQLWDGLRLEDDVFVGPNVTFSNDKYVRSRQRPEAFATTLVKHGASIGANATILPGVVIGAYAMVGAGAVVTRNVPDYAKVVGNPARITGYVDRAGQPLERDAEVVSGSAPGAPAVSTFGKTPLGIGASYLSSWPVQRDLRGSLIAVETAQALPFDIKRFFFVFGVPGVHVRGAHSHRECHQFLICVTGSVSVLLDDGEKQSSVTLSHPQHGVYVPPMIWSVQYKHSPDAKLLVLASHSYDAADYIRDYDEFLAAVRKASAGA